MQLLGTAEEAERKRKRNKTLHPAALAQYAGLFSYTQLIHRESLQASFSSGSFGLSLPTLSAACSEAEPKHALCKLKRTRISAWIQLNLTVSICPKTNHCQVDTSRIGESQFSNPHQRRVCLATYFWPHNTAAKAHRIFAYTPPNDLYHNAFY